MASKWKEAFRSWNFYRQEAGSSNHWTYNMDYILWNRKGKSEDGAKSWGESLQAEEVNPNEGIGNMCPGGFAMDQRLLLAFCFLPFSNQSLVLTILWLPHCVYWVYGGQIICV